MAMDCHPFGVSSDSVRLLSLSKSSLSRERTQETEKTFESGPHSGPCF